ncbi:Hypothetical predicted protein [Octopus vulgaris]|uniref:Uncharacterized protein n=1 Tax=Octopus vulgaris TaxID=6645 RepID=A0AA36FHI7_OCTVU|nr:Hypothetical predicted protein [Octopus vulgaris]
MTDETRYPTKRVRLTRIHKILLQYMSQHNVMAAGKDIAPAMLPMDKGSAPRGVKRKQRTLSIKDKS